MNGNDISGRVKSLFSTSSVLVGWSVHSVGGSREDKERSKELTREANAIPGAMRCTVQHMPERLRARITEYANEGNVLLKRHGLPWGSGLYLMSLQTYLSEVKPDLVKAKLMFDSEMDQLCDNWDLLIAKVKNDLKDGYNPAALPRTGMEARRKFSIEISVMQIPPAAIGLDGLSPEERKEIEADIRGTFENKFRELTDSLVEQVVDFAKRLLEIGGKIEKGLSNGHDMRSFHSVKEKLKTIMYKVREISGTEENEGTKKLTELIGTIAQATKGPKFDNTVLADLIAGN